MGKHIQDRRTAGKAGGKGMVRALVIKEAGFLAAHDIGHIGGPVHRHRDRRIDLACKKRGLLSQAFQAPRPARAVLDHAGDTRHRLQRSDQRRQMRLGPSRIGLDHRGIAKAVDHHTGQPVSLGMDQPVKRRIEQPRAQGQCAGQTGFKPALVNLRLGVAVEHPGDDLGFGVDGDKAQGPALTILQHRQRAGGKALGAPVGHQLISIDPRKAVADGAGFGLGLQPNHSSALRGGVIIGGRRGHHASP